MRKIFQKNFKDYKIVIQKVLTIKNKHAIMQLVNKEGVVKSEI